MITAPMFAASRYEQVDVAGLVERDGGGTGDHVAHLRPRQHHRDEERELAEPHEDADPLRPAVAPEQRDGEQQHGRDGDREPPRDPEQLPDARDAGELGEERPDRRQQQGAGRQVAPATPELLADEQPVTLAGHDAEAHRDLLHHEQDRDEQQLRQQHRVAPRRPGLGRRDEAPGVRVREHHDQAGAPDAQQPALRGDGLGLPLGAGGRGGVRGHGVPR
nr:hypothetical protein [Amnibacterium sp.]